MATIDHLLHIAGEFSTRGPRKAMENGNFLVLKQGCRRRRQESLVASGEHAVGSTMLLCVVYRPDPILMAVAWARDEGGGEVGIVGAIERHRELAKRNGTQPGGDYFGRVKIESKCEMSDFASVKIRGVA